MIIPNLPTGEAGTILLKLSAAHPDQPPTEPWDAESALWSMLAFYRHGPELPDGMHGTNCVTATGTHYIQRTLTVPHRAAHKTLSVSRTEDAHRPNGGHLRSRWKTLTVSLRRKRGNRRREIGAPPPTAIATPTEQIPPAVHVAKPEGRPLSGLPRSHAAGTARSTVTNQQSTAVAPPVSTEE
jgi:hypothetical protein